MRHSRRQRASLPIHRDQRGQSLVIVLSLITILFLLGSALAVHASAALRATRAAESQGDDFYAADAATELGIWWQRNGKAGNPPAQTINGVTTATTITTSAGGGGSCPADNTPIWMTGFEHGAVPGTATSLFGAPSGGSGSFVESTVARTGTYSARVTVPTGTGSTAYFTASSGISWGTIEVLHFAFQFAALPTADAVVGWIWTNGTTGSPVQATLLYKASSGKWGMALHPGGTWSVRTEITGTMGPVAGQWQTIDIKFQNYVNPAVVDWYVDGVAQPQHTYAWTGSPTNTGVNFGQSSLYTTATYTGYYDDIMISKTSTDFPLPDIRINALKPNAMGTHITPGNYQNNDNTAISATSWQRLDEIPLTSTTDWIKQVTNGGGSYIEIAFEDTAQTCVRGASLFMGIRSTATQNNNAALNSVTNGFNYTIWSGASNFTTLRYVQGVTTQNALNPGTGPWTQAIVNGIVARWGFSTDVSPNPYLDGIVLEYAWMNVASGPSTVTIVGTGGGSTTTTTYPDAGAGVPTLSTWTVTK
jgi:Tfp pilus assembly protein PilX